MSAELFDFVRSRYPSAGVASVTLEDGVVVIATARPVLLIGKDGARYEQLCAELAELRGTKSEVNLVQISRPELEAVLVADDLAKKLSRHSAPQQLLEVIAEQCLRAGAKGCHFEVRGAITASCERGTLEAPREATTAAVKEPPLMADENGYPLPPPPQPDPPPTFAVTVRISR